MYFTHCDKILLVDWKSICKNFNFLRVEKRKMQCSSSKDKGANNTLEIGARLLIELVNRDRERTDPSTFFFLTFWVTR